MNFVAVFIDIRDEISPAEILLPGFRDVDRQSLRPTARAWSRSSTGWPVGSIIRCWSTMSK
jgi:hypothetical protein